MNRKERRAKEAAAKARGEWAEVRHVDVGDGVSVTLMMGPSGFTAEWENRPPLLTDEQVNAYRCGRNELVQAVVNRTGEGCALYEEEGRAIYGFVPGGDGPTITLVRGMGGRLFPPS